jgi:rubrerythrin
MEEMTLRMEYRTEDRCKLCNTPLESPPAEECPYCGKDQEENLIQNDTYKISGEC